MEYPNLIARLLPIGEERRSKNCQLAWDAVRMNTVEDISRQVDPDISMSRSGVETPGSMLSQEDNSETFDTASEKLLQGIPLLFKPGPKGLRGIVLGSGPDCDIILPSQPKRLLKDGQTSIMIKIVDIYFRIVVAPFEHDLQQYNTRVDQFLENLKANNTLPIGQLGIRSSNPTALPSGAHTPAKEGERLTIVQEELGAGTFGFVRHEWNVSTGVEYAVKVPNLKTPNSVTFLAREAATLAKISHDHVIKMVEFITQPPQLVLEYAMFGTLADQNNIQSGESIALLQQGLSALEYLHGFSIPIVHRDIKPENILIWFRNPIHMKFADFGLSKIGQDLATQCGSPYYQAPEVFSGDIYTSKVDVWSFGLVIFQSAYTLPKPLNTGQKWCRQIVEFAITHESRPLIDLLTNSMLIMDPRCRGSAKKCQEDAMELTRISRRSTPTQESFLQNKTKAVLSKSLNVGTVTELVTWASPLPNSDVSTSLRKSKRTAPPAGSSKNDTKRQQTTSSKSSMHEGSDPLLGVFRDGRVQYGSSIAEYLGGGDDGDLSFSSWGKSSKLSKSQITEELSQPAEISKGNDLLLYPLGSPVAQHQESRTGEGLVATVAKPLYAGNVETQSFGSNSWKDSKKSWTESRKNEYMDALLLMPLPGAESF
ncbi:Protein kinase-like (PK-like) [Glarea lozoyensis ATCC 20868]|uniref:non-specific serine/threonine protein kinase n=1 Tax=Glarea lozoyensis (strain ATCC 20868 / MF5171) TaxID=1116229 RepID=S3CXE6_GLAL2|nr:Protein kinase-like (PK-like) [Glarea lozoyensis ATCC 20868]EPE31017.1 Protein kinase-like (PK-like) [Glarea lozoyensis ATCC 20868]